MRATVEHIGIDEDLPPIEIKVVRGREDLSIKACFFVAVRIVRNNHFISDK